MSEVSNQDQLDGRLLRGAATGDIALVQIALQDGADIAARQKQGLMALHLAVAMNDLALATYLVEEASAPFVPDGFGRLPSVIAAQCKVSEELSDYILEKEAEAVADAE